MNDSSVHGTTNMDRAQAMRTFRRLMRYPMLFRSALIWFVVFVALAVTCSVLGPRILGLATTKIFTDVMAIAEGSRTTIDLVYIGRIGLFLLVLYGCAFFFQYMQGRLMTRITNRSTYHIRRHISEKLNRLPLSYFAEHPYAEVLSRITNDADVIAVTFNQVMTQTINSVLTIIGITIIMFTMNALLACIILLLIPGAVVAAHFVAHRSQKYFGLLQDRMQSLTTAAADAYSQRGMSAWSDSVEAGFQADNAAVCEAAWKSQAISGLLHPIMNTMSTIAYIVVCVLGGLLVIQGRLTIGEIQAFIQYVRSFSQPLVQLSWISSSIQGLLAAADHIFQFLDEEETEAPGDETKGNADIDFTDVCYSHPQKAFSLRNITLHIPAGTLAAVTGPEGSGKTTLMDLLMHLRNPESGSIQVGARDVRSLSAQNDAKIFGAALQRPWLHSETIAENISYGVPTASREQIEAAAEQVGADAFIRARAGSYDAEIGECLHSLSQGEIQLLQAARLELSDPDILVLDNAFDSVDAITYRRVMERFLTEKPGKTKFLVTANPDELAAADMVVFLEDGKIAGQGTHAELLRSNAAYRAFLYGETDEDCSRR